MSLSQNSQQRYAEKFGSYAPPVPFPSEGTPEFSDQVTYMLQATRTWLRKIYEFTPTLIELHRLRNAAVDLARFYSTIGTDTSGWERIAHIPTEIFYRFRLQDGWTLRQIALQLDGNREDIGRMLRLEQQLDHHE